MKSLRRITRRDLPPAALVLAGLLAATLLTATVACSPQPSPDPNRDGAVDDHPLEVPTIVLPERSLTCDLQAKPSYIAGERVEVIFRITNHGQTPLWLLHWNTPIEGLIGDCFEIFRDGKVVFFQGRMIKRARPEASEYVRIDPGQTLSAPIDLRAAYQVEKPGRYELRFDSVLFDVTDDPQQVPRPIEEHQSFDPHCPDVVFEVR